MSGRYLLDTNVAILILNQEIAVEARRGSEADEYDVACHVRREHMTKAHEADRIDHSGGEGQDHQGRQQLVLRV